MKGLRPLSFVPVLLFALGACDQLDRSPSIQRLEPEFGSTAGGETVLIVGSSFSSQPGVWFAGAPAISVERLDSERLRVTTPPGAEGPVDVMVSNGDGKDAAASGAYTYQDPAISPSLVSIAPSSGFAGGGTDVALTGLNFQNGATVLFEGSPAGNIVVLSATSITLTTAPMPEGALDVVVVNPDGRRAVIVDGFTSTGLTADEYEVLQLVNQERALAGLGPLAINYCLVRAARKHSQDMIDRDFFAHVNPDGIGPAQRAAAEGYASGYVGENIAAGYTTPQAAMTAWMNSPGHRANILNTEYTEIGIGWKLGGTYDEYWTQVFGKP